MSFISWGLVCEGPSDASYLEVLIPRVLEAVLSEHALRVITIADFSTLTSLHQAPIELARRIAPAAASFDVLFVHHDTGGRHLARTCHGFFTDLNAALDTYPNINCGRVTLCPCHETEAWVLADSQAVIDALGITTCPRELGLPSSPLEAERLTDPKATLSGAINQAGLPPHAISLLFAQIAQNQRIEVLRRSRSFAQFERDLITELRRRRYC